MSKFLFFFGLLLQVYFVTSLSAQQLKLQGRVVDSLHVGLAGVSVRVYTGKDTLSAGTDNDGNFSLQLIPKGNLNLTVSMMGYKTYTQNLNDIGDEDHFILPPIILQSKTQRLQEVTVKTVAIRVAKIRSNTMPRLMPLLSMTVWKTCCVNCRESTSMLRAM
ncbi:carboxypeptidase-like regulatory domain-containing protein [Sphingobacterium sp. KU25419]|nr:carboxypeptidase-like regulatory domain-containing protein [Sphingobacterium sp. KU25419]